MPIKAEQRIKVFQVLGGDAWGGGGVVVLAICRSLLEYGCEVWVLCGEDHAAKEFSKIGAKVIRIASWRRSINPVNDVVSFGRLYVLCHKQKFDIVVTHTSKGGFLGRIAARLAGVPRVIHTVHGFAFHEFSSKFATFLYTNLERLAAHFCDLVICVNQEERDFAIDKNIVSLEKIVTVQNGIDFRKFDGIKPSVSLLGQIGASNGGPIVGAVGRLTTQKGFEYLIKAIPFVLKEHHDTLFVFAGNGPLEADLVALAKNLNVDGRCRFLGFWEDVPGLLAVLDVFVLPSLWEGLSITLLEAMAAGKAVVATDIKGNREVVENGVNGFLVTPANPRNLSSKVIELLTDSIRAELLGQNAKLRVVQNFSEEAMVQKTLYLYGVIE